MKPQILFILTLFLGHSVFAAGGNGMSFMARYGVPNFQLEDSLGKYKYNGFVLNAEAQFPLFKANEGFNPKLTAGVKLNDLSNTASNEGLKERARHFGLGLGCHIEIYRFFMGFNYYQMRSQHFWSGSLSTETQFDYGSLGYYLGAGKKLSNSLSITFSIHQEGGTWSANKTSMGRDLDMTNLTYFIGLQIRSGTTLSDALKFLFK